MNNQEIRITRAGYLYIDGVRVYGPITPLRVPGEFGAEVQAVCREWAHKHYRMVADNRA
jgi:hypothetical protein